MSELTLGSLFSGSGGFELAGAIFGLEPLWASEVEPFPIMVTATNFPEMEHLGDINKIDGTKIQKTMVIAGGSPCQDMSVAGKREGLDGERSGLFRQQIRVVKEMRQSDREAGRTGKQIRPRFMVWENVPGAYSSNKGEDFRCVLEEICKIAEPEVSVPRPPKGKWGGQGAIMGDGYSVAWRTLDAQYWGVPQRRKRIYLVADFGGQSAPEILFEREGLQRNFKESREAWKDSARGAADSINKTNKETANTCFDISDRRRVADECTGVAPTLTGRMGTGGNNQPIVLENHPNDSRVDICDDGICPTLTGRMGTGGGNVPMVMEDKAFLEGGGRWAMSVDTSHADDVVRMDTIAPTITARDYKGGNCLIEAVPVTMQIRSGCEGGGKGPLLQMNKSASLTTVQTQTLFVPVDGSEKTMIKKAIPIADKATRCKGGGDTRNDDGAGNGLGIGELGAPAYTLTAADKHAVAYAIDRAAFNQGENALYGISIEEEVAQTLVAKGPNAVAQPIKTACCWDGGQIVNTLTSSNADGSQRMPDKDHCNAIIEKTYQRVSGPLMASGYEKNGTQEAMNDMYVATEYIVRRLTPTECCRLQGFPDYWTHNIGIKEPTEDDILYWKSIFKEYTQAMGQKKREKTDKQIAKWIKNPDSDSAKYKMWGNGIALPCAMFVMEGIVEVLQRESKQEEQE